MKVRFGGVLADFHRDLFKSGYMARARIRKHVLISLERDYQLYTYFRERAFYKNKKCLVHYLMEIDIAFPDLSLCANPFDCDRDRVVPWLRLTY